MAPNLITLCGLGFILLNVLSVIIWIPDLVGPGPRWLYFSFPLGMWLYSTFDNVDGYINGPTEGLIVACLLQLLSAIAGPEWWTQDLRDLFEDSVPSFIPKGCTSADVLLVAMAFSVCTLHIPASFYNVDQHFILFELTLVLLIPLFGGAVLTNIPVLFNTGEILSRKGDIPYGKQGPKKIT
ncbi:unnamed protein product [Rhizophagus irregularis]|nr:unnamed protein product [Rhizophagus irregularis]